MKFIVTGGNGYIGQHMCKYLFQKGHEVSIIDNFSTSPQKKIHSYGNFYIGDITDKLLLQKILDAEKKIDGVFHFAAHSIVPESEEKPMNYYHENVIKTLTFIGHLIDFKIENIVFSSTCAVYGIPQNERIKEDDPHNPINTYGQTKKIIEIFIKDLALKKKINALILRYFNVAGSSPELEIGENHSPESHLIPNLCLNYLNQSMKKFSIFGNSYPTRDGTCIRDYIHVEDLVRAHYLGFEYLQKEKGLHHFNLGSEEGHSVLEVIQTFEEVAKTSIERNFTKARSGDPAILLADSTKIHQLLNFYPQYNLRDAITHTFNYLKKMKALNGN